MHFTLSPNCVQVQTLQMAQDTPVLTDSFSRGCDSYTHACKARLLSTDGSTSLSVIVIVIVNPLIWTVCRVGVSQIWSHGSVDLLLSRTRRLGVLNLCAVCLCILDTSSKIAMFYSVRWESEPWNCWVGVSFDVFRLTICTAPVAAFSNSRSLSWIVLGVVRLQRSFLLVP